MVLLFSFIFNLFTYLPPFLCGCWQETDDDLETGLEDSQDEYEGNKDAARALMRVKQKLDGYEEGELRSVHGQVTFQSYYYLNVSMLFTQWILGMNFFLFLLVDKFEL